MAPPGERVGFGPRRVGQGKPAAPPVALLHQCGQVRQAKTFQRDRLNPTGEGLGRLSQQFRRGAAENQKAGWQRLAIGEHPQQRKQVGPALDLVNDHYSPERTQYRVRLVEAGQARGIFEIEVVKRFCRYELAHQRGLTALARPQKRHHAAALQSGLHQSNIVFRSILVRLSTMNIPQSMRDIHGATCP